ncbi:FkbM family methyltransferase [Pseudorhodoferax soli]|uniref:FkbM family methyltransferase n=1 Tax=Pseudorhodoferax soli TaxID=545864 RepID=A0A368XI41_9BURK|nr:FkbM family methyltransferase [Pseudorhodoferax soli]RCW67613.1 FkbM family methyltransferase [Pseudorhodoferax soli]
MKTDIDDIRKKVVQAAAANYSPPKIEALAERPVFLMGPTSTIGSLFGKQVAAATRVVAAVDDISKDASIHGAPRWTSAEFLERAKKYPNAIAIDFSGGPYVRWLVTRLCEDAGGVERRDFALVANQLKLSAVFETCDVYRDRTLGRMDEFLAVADRFTDELSRATLYSNLLFRLTCDRDHLLPVWNPYDEYFARADHGQTVTFKPGLNEHFVDCGAHQGTIIQRLLGATGGRYKSITAFEPDRINFEKLQNLVPMPLPNYKPINKAVSNKHEKLRFVETGTMSSYVSANGNTVVQTTTLDDEVEQATFLKMDIEGFESKALQGSTRLLAQRPRVAVCVYHLAHDLLDVLSVLDKNVENYHYKLRQHYAGWYYDLVLYGSPVDGVDAPSWAA